MIYLSEAGLIPCSFSFLPLSHLVHQSIYSLIYQFNTGSWNRVRCMRCLLIQNVKVLNIWDTSKMNWDPGWFSSTTLLSPPHLFVAQIRCLLFSISTRRVCLLSGPGNLESTETRGDILTLKHNTCPPSKITSITDIIYIPLTQFKRLPSL